MQFVGMIAFPFGYACVYTAVQMLKRPPNGQSGSVLYWLTGITSLGAPSMGGSSATTGSRKNQTGKTPNSPPTSPPQRTGRGTHSI